MTDKSEERPKRQVRDSINEAVTNPEAWFYRHFTIATICNTLLVAVAAAALGAIVGLPVFMWLKENEANTVYYVCLLMGGTAAQIAFAWVTTLWVIPRATSWAGQLFERRAEKRGNKVEVKEKHEQRVVEETENKPKLGPALLAAVGIAHASSKLNMDFWTVIALSGLAAACIVITRNLTEHKTILRMTGRMKNNLAP
ncbi:MAG: hypothetical protein F4X64_16990 [Chloroflexi bacterium]|nr:hypothetical protein [Chloroflexota bacterium]